MLRVAHRAGGGGFGSGQLEQIDGMSTSIIERIRAAMEAGRPGADRNKIRSAWSVLCTQCGLTVSLSKKPDYSVYQCLAVPVEPNTNALVARRRDDPPA